MSGVWWRIVWFVRAGFRGWMLSQGCSGATRDRYEQIHADAGGTERIRYDI